MVCVCGVYDVDNGWKADPRSISVLGTESIRAGGFRLGKMPVASVSSIQSDNSAPVSAHLCKQSHGERPI